jgi:hypothetical protein
MSKHRIDINQLSNTPLIRESTSSQISDLTEYCMKNCNMMLKIDTYILASKASFLSLDVYVRLSFLPSEAIEER